MTDKIKLKSIGIAHTYDTVQEAFDYANEMDKQNGSSTHNVVASLVYNAVIKQLANQYPDLIEWEDGLKIVENK